MIRQISILLLSFGTCLWTTPANCAAAPGLATKHDAGQEVNWQFTDVEGRVHRPFEEESTRGIALVFISTDCPIANSYQPMLQRLAKEYRERGIRFFMIHPNPKVPVEEARKHAKEYRITTPVVIDRELAISRRVKATVTPQAFVFVRDQEQAAYQGRIDNLYAGYGKKRNVATTHELAEALEAVATGGHVQMPKTKAVGCFISYPKQTDSVKSSEANAG